jgi:hypothetical protein
MVKKNQETDGFSFAVLRILKSPGNEDQLMATIDLGINGNKIFVDASEEHVG